MTDPCNGASDVSGRRRLLRPAVLSAMLAALVAGLLLMPAASPATPGAASIGASQNGARTIAFTGDAAGATSWSWDFGDGTTDTAQNPTHTYGAAGDYTVTLTASDGVAPDVSATTTVHVYDTPGADFTFSGGPTVSFSDTSGGEPTAWHWDFGDGNQSNQRNPTHTFAPGSHLVTLTTSNPAGSSPPTTKVVTISPANHAPTAEFTITTTPTSVGSLVQFDASTSTDPDGNPLTYAWDLDGNGTYTDATGVTASRSFPAAGTYTVGLRVSDGSLTDKQFHTVTVVDDRPPVAAFTFAPASPAVGTGVTFTSASSDPDGQIAKLEWDLNGDGTFGEAQGPTAGWAFGTPGPHTVSLRATDDRGVSAIAFQTIDVSGPNGGTPAVQPTSGSAPGALPPSPKAPSLSKPKLMSPFPVVRIRGVIVGARVRISVLSVRAPKGATVRARCRGRGCPAGWSTQRVRSAAHSVRFRRLERSVRPGTIIEVYVRSAKAIGKYTRFDIRAGKAPLRRDMCLAPGSMRPTRCPAQ